jgi:hypothetical protein
MRCDVVHAEYLKTISWFDEKLIDWSNGGILYTVAGEKRQFGKYIYAFNFDTSIISTDGRYAFIYQKLGTKGLLLKNGDLLREINRSYYCADAYEYPAAFVTIFKTTYLVHCPIEYKRLDFENVETGEIVTNVSQRNPADFFHSRLVISPGNTFLMSRGWFWHPCDYVKVFKILDCINNPLLLDEAILSPGIGTEICTASFINDHKVLLGASDEVFNDEDLNPSLPSKNIAIWNLNANEITGKTKVESEFGNLFAINEELAWDMYCFPKIIEIKTGKILDQNESIFCGRQRSGIVSQEDALYKICFNNHTKQIAIAHKNEIKILTP